MGEYFLVPDDVEDYAAEMSEQIARHARGENGPIISQFSNGPQTVYEGPPSTPGLIEATIDTCKKYVFENVHKINPLGYENMRESTVDLLDGGAEEIYDRLKEQGYDLNEMSVEELTEFKERILGGLTAVAGSELGDLLQDNVITEKELNEIAQSVGKAVVAFTKHIDELIEEKSKPENNMDKAPEGPVETDVAATTTFVPGHEQAAVLTGPEAIAAVAQFDFSGDGATFSGNDPGLATHLNGIIPVNPDFLPSAAPVTTPAPDVNLNSTGPSQTPGLGS